MSSKYLLLASRGLVQNLRIPSAYSGARLPHTPPLGNETGVVRAFSNAENQRLNQETTSSPIPADVQQSVKKERFSTAPQRLAIAFAVISAGACGYWLGTNQTHQTNQPHNSDLDSHSTLPLDAVQPPKYRLGKADLEAARSEFVKIVGEDNVGTSTDDLKSHSTSDWSSHPADHSHSPFCVVYPASTEDMSKIMKVCHTRRIPVTGYSGGTSLEGHFEPTQGGVCVDFARMDKVLALHKDDMDVVVQPAVGWQDLNEQLAEENLFFPPDPGPGAMIGGMVGTGCSGTNAYRYGTMREWVLSLTVVLADGTVVKTRRRPRKSSAGYDLTHLFIGSEGTLGLVTEATLKLTTLPQNTSVAVCSFRNVRDAANCVASVVDQSVPVAAVEILNEACMRMINEAGITTRQWKPTPTLFFKFNGSAGGVREEISQVQAIARKAGSLSFDFADNADECEELWSARHQALWSIVSLKQPNDHVWTTDVAVPVSRLPKAIENAQEKLQQSGLRGIIVGHVGDGNFHCFILYNDKQRKIAEGFVHGMVDRALGAEGTVTGEHGIGLVKRDFLVRELGKDTVDAMRKLKQAFDPLCLLNCDKVVRMQNGRSEGNL